MSGLNPLKAYSTATKPRSIPRRAKSSEVEEDETIREATERLLKDKMSKEVLEDTQFIDKVNWDKVTDAIIDMIGKDVDKIFAGVTTTNN